MKPVALLALAMLAPSFVSAKPLPDSANNTLGAKAPALTLSKFVQGNSFSSFKPGQVYVVEFWATWCGPCKVSIPHLNEMSKKFGSKVNMLGVSIWESQQVVAESDHAKVTDFVKGMGDKMSYNIAIDTTNGDMAKNWMEAWGQNGIPSAFIIDQQGRVAYIGHPMDPKFEKSLGEVVEGKFDLAAAKAEMDAELAKAAAQQEASKKLNAGIKEKSADFKALVKQGKLDAAVELMEGVNKTHGNADLGVLVMPESMVLQNLSTTNEALYYSYAKQLSDGKMAKDPMWHNSVAWGILTSKKFKSPNYQLAKTLALRASALMDNKDPQILDTLSLAYFRTGNTAKAIEVQVKAVSLVSGAEKAEYQKRIEEYKSGKVSV